MKVTADDLKSQGLIDDVIDEPTNGAHRNKEAAAVAIADYVKKSLNELENIDVRELSANRMQKNFKAWSLSRGLGFYFAFLNNFIFIIVIKIKLIKSILFLYFKNDFKYQNNYF